MSVSKRVQQLTPSATLATAAKAQRLKDQGIDVISLTLGEPDFHTPKHIQQAAIQAITDGVASFYTASTGMKQLKQGILDRTKADIGVAYELDEVVVTHGAKFGLYSLFQALLDPEDEVIIPAPYWVSYVEQVKLAEGVAKKLVPQSAHQFKVTLAELEKLTSEKTKALVLTSPSNPTGAVYTKEELKEIGQWAVRHNIYIIADEIYGKLVYNGMVFHSLASLGEQIKKQILLINGVSKAYSMTGWRIGYVLGDQEIIAGIGAVASQATSNPATVSQYAALEALTGPQDKVEEMRLAFEERLNVIYPLVKALPGVKLTKPEGAFYLFPDVKETVALCGYSDTESFVDALLEEAHVAVVAGAGFGAPDHIRLSYATDLETLKEAVKRMQYFIEKKSKKV